MKNGPSDLDGPFQIVVKLRIVMRGLFFCLADGVSMKLRATEG